MAPKIIIYVKNGIVASLHANMDLTYVVIDHDPNATIAEDEIIVGNANEPDSVDSDINLDKALEYLDIPAVPPRAPALESKEPEIIYAVRAPYPWSGLEEIKDFDDPNIIKGHSFHEIYYKLTAMGICITQEENVMSNGYLTIDVRDITNEKDVFPIVYEWYFEDEAKNEAFEREDD